MTAQVRIAIHICIGIIFYQYISFVPVDENITRNSLKISKKTNQEVLKEY